MSHFLKLKLHTLCSSRLPSPALASKLFKSPDPRCTSWRWYGEGAVLEDHGDGASMAANQEDALAKEFEGVKGGATKRISVSLNANSLDPDYLESSLGKLTNLVPENSEANPNIQHVGKGSTNQTQSDRLSAEVTNKSATNDKWEQMVSNVRSMALKKKLKAGDANNSGSPKSGQIESQLGFSDSDPPHTGGHSSVPQCPTVSSKEPLSPNKSSKSFKAQSQSSNQPKSKATMEDVVKSNSLHDLLGEKRMTHQQPNQQKAEAAELLNPRERFFQNKNQQKAEVAERLNPRDGFFQNKNQQRNKDMSLLNSKSKDYSFTRASDVSICHDGNHLTSKNAVQEPLHFKLPQGSDDAFMSAKGTNSSISREATHRASSNSDGVSKQAYMVCVQNLPSSSNPSMVKSSMALHGEVTALFKKPVRDRLYVYIQFKTAEAMESALAARKLQFGGKTYYITRADHSVLTTVVRVSKVSNDTDESQLRSVCGQYGKVDNVRKRAYGVFDVFYDVKELTKIPSILASLSEVNLNRSTWFALPAPLLHPSVQKEVMKSPEGQSWHDIQVNQAINRIEAGLDVVSVLFEDLKQLNSVAKEYSK